MSHVERITEPCKDCSSLAVDADVDLATIC